MANARLVAESEGGKLAGGMTQTLTHISQFIPPCQEPGRMN